VVGAVSIISPRPNEEGTTDEGTTPKGNVSNSVRGITRTCPGVRTQGNENRTMGQAETPCQIRTGGNGRLRASEEWACNPEVAPTTSPSSLKHLRQKHQWDSRRRQSQMPIRYACTFARMEPDQYLREHNQQRIRRGQRVRSRSSSSRHGAHFGEVILGHNGIGASAVTEQQPVNPQSNTNYGQFNIEENSTST
jgi:hypothetical protein